MVDEICLRPGETSPTSPTSLRDALSELGACADRLAAGDPARPNRETVAQYLDALELGIRHCFARPELGCWLDVLCPLKENLGSFGAYAQSLEPAPVDPALLTATVVLTHLALSLERQPTDALVREVLLDVMGARVWSWPLPAAARPALRASFGHPDLPSAASLLVGSCPLMTTALASPEDPARLAGVAVPDLMH